MYKDDQQYIQQSISSMSRYRKPLSVIDIDDEEEMDMRGEVLLSRFE